MLGTFQLRCKCAWHLGTDLQICVVCRRLMADQVVVCFSVIYSLFKDTLLMCIYIYVYVCMYIYIYVMWCWLLSEISAFLSCALLPARVLVLHAVLLHVLQVLIWTSRSAPPTSVAYVEVPAWWMLCKHAHMHGAMSLELVNCKRSTFFPRDCERVSDCKCDFLITLLFQCQFSLHSSMWIAWS